MIAGNAVERFTVGILVGMNAQTTGTEVQLNVTSLNRLAGIQVGDTNRQTLVKENVSNNNVYGIRTTTASVMGNEFVGNSMRSNSGSDAVESSFTTGTDGSVTLNNTWRDNKCTSDTPQGTICGK